MLRGEADAERTMRLVPGQEPAAAQAGVERHPEAQCPPGVALVFHYRPGGTHASTLGAQQSLLLAAEPATEWIDGRRPVRARAGGTVPITTLFFESLGIDRLMCGLAVPDDDAHAPHGFLRLRSLDEGLRSWPLLLTQPGALAPEGVPKHRRD